MKKILIGSVMAFGTYSALVYADQVINDDLIVTQSVCVGQDCVNGESFGFDTLRLKENNLRIKFQDTSNSASFPSNDWQITANDSSNGGLNKFSIEDIDGGRIPFTIEASAPSNSLYVDDGGRVGFGTATPVVETHVVNGDSPTLRLEQDGSSGFTPQTWDIASNETNFFVRDVSNGSQLPFRIRPGADTSALDIQADNDIGLGTQTPDARLHVNINGGEEPSFLINQDGTADSTQLIVAADGNIGIGLGSPKTMLHINAEAAAGEVDLHIESSSNADAFAGFGATPGFIGNSDALILGYNGSNGGHSFIGTRPSTTGGGTLKFSIENSTEMTLTSEGLELSSGNDFKVAGVALNVPDYVFLESYNLMSIQDLSEYIEKEKHLPGIPSEKEIKEGSLSIADFQMKLLEKIEELTLHTISQEEKLSVLAKRNEALQLQLNKILANK